MGAVQNMSSKSADRPSAVGSDCLVDDVSVDLGRFMLLFHHPILQPWDPGSRSSGSGGESISRSSRSAIGGRSRRDGPGGGRLLLRGISQLADARRTDISRQAIFERESRTFFVFWHGS